VACKSNQHQLGIALQIYGGGNNDKIMDLTQPPATIPPATSYGGAWPWDLSSVFINAMIENGCTRNIFYDPGYAAWNSDDCWNFQTVYSGVAAANVTFRITGYLWQLKGIPQLPSTVYTATKLTADGAHPPTSVSFAACVIVSYPVKQVYANITAVGTAAFAAKDPQSTAHLIRGRPPGSNHTYIDGHVDWVRYQDMTNSIGNSGGSPLFEW
jgi:hypothetical protein